MGSPRILLEGITVEELVDALAAAVRDRLSARSDELCDQSCPPAPLTRRSYMDAAKAGRFPFRREGKRLVARRADVVSWLTEGATKQRARKPREPAQSEYDRVLEANSLVRS